MATLGPLELLLPNWHWRRSILFKHDSHQIHTGYDTSAHGELLVALWELRARVFHDPRARSLCAVLMMLGLIRYLRATWAAFKRRQRER